MGQVGGQSVSHAHCHLVPRYREERYAGKGLRWWFKQPENAFSPERAVSAGGARSLTLWVVFVTTAEVPEVDRHAERDQ